MVLVFGMDLPLLEFILVLNIIMLIYIVISMFEIRSLIKVRKDLEELLGKTKIDSLKEKYKPPEPQKDVVKVEEVYKEQSSS